MSDDPYACADSSTDLTLHPLPLLECCKTHDNIDTHVCSIENSSSLLPLPSAHTLSIVSWNVSGDLNNKIEQDHFTNFVKRHDIVFLSETWSNSLQESNLRVTDYNALFKHRRRKKKAKRDSGGIACFYKKSLSSGITLHDWDFEDGICLKLDKVFFTLENDVFVLSPYIRPQSSSRQDAETGPSHFDILEDKICELKQKGNIVVLGDLNARSGDLDDIDTHLIHPQSQRDYLCASHIPHCCEELTHSPITPHLLQSLGHSVHRTNSDHTVNEYGRKLVDLCCSCSMVILNGRVGRDRDHGQMTFHNHRGQSAIDYALSDSAILPYCTNFEVKDINIIYSDHSPIVLTIEFAGFDNDINGTHTQVNVPIYRWNPSKRDDLLKKSLLLSS